MTPRSLGLVNDEWWAWSPPWEFRQRCSNEPGRALDRTVSQISIGGHLAIFPARQLGTKWQGWTEVEQKEQQD